MTPAPTKLIVALDVTPLPAALRMVDTLGEAVQWFKIGSHLFCESGPEAVAALKARGKKIFLDLKFHDIPNTVASAVRACANLGVDMLNVHASGGLEMMRAAVKAADEPGSPRPLVIAVTVLTSLDKPALSELLNRQDDYAVATHATHLARLAKTAGLDGVVCSAHEVAIIREACGPDFALVVPGIRPAGSAVGDQKRIMTPAAAAAAGAGYIVVGRPILDAADPKAAASAVTAELAFS